MISSSGAECSRLFNALVILLAVRSTESLIMINTHQHASGRPLKLSSSPLDNQLKIQGMCDTFDCNERSSGEECVSIDYFTRRRGGCLFFRSILVGAFQWKSFRQISHAEGDPATLIPTNKSIFLSGRINLPAGMTRPDGIGNHKSETFDSTNNGEKLPTKPAIYVTARPNRPDNVPKAILDGSRGKTPPILAARFESPTFPFEFELGEKDLTPEGAESDDNQKSTNSGRFWWATDDLIVSARWDNDGIAATRSPEDLVGRNVWKQGMTATDKNDGSAGFVLDLQGRGAFGKFATKKN